MVELQGELQCTVGPEDSHGAAGRGQTELEGAGLEWGRVLRGCGLGDPQNA